MHPSSIAKTCEHVNHVPNILILNTGLSEVKDGARCDVSIGVGMFSQDPSPAYRDHRRPLRQISALNEPSRSFTVPGEGPS